MSQRARALLAMLKIGGLMWSSLSVVAAATGIETSDKPHIVLVMADDMGWGQTGYRGHPILKTPNLDQMAANGLRLERFYAGSPVCSPTRASVLTGRSPNRSGVLSHGYALRKQERTVAQALRQLGYITAHFGKWHLNGFRGPGAPLLGTDPYHPGQFGFDYWLSVTNFFDRGPLMSRMGQFEEFTGDSSEVIVREALNFMREHAGKRRPMFVVIWFGSPHSPFRASAEDMAPFRTLDNSSAHHYGELVAMDRAVGSLREGLRQLGIAQDTLLFFCSDNGGLANIRPDTVGGLRGHKGTLYEGGIRVPAIIEWPAVIHPRVSRYPACTMDIFPTIAEITGLSVETMLRPQDGISLVPLFREELGERPRPIGFRYQRQAALIDNRWKILARQFPQEPWELYDLTQDPQEAQDLSQQERVVFDRMKRLLEQWCQSVDNSFAGGDYPERRLVPPDPPSRAWYEAEEYEPWLEAWKERWEYRSVLQRQR